MPLGLLVAIYLNEYGAKGFSTVVRLLVDVMTGIPSIVAGLFVLAFWVLGLHEGYSGFAGSMALAILMLPVVTRSSEEMLRLVPNSLREAAVRARDPEVAGRSCRSSCRPRAPASRPASCSRSRA